MLHSSSGIHNTGERPPENNPDYVVVGETRSYDYKKIERAVRLILKGARFRDCSNATGRLWLDSHRRGSEIDHKPNRG